MKKYKKYTNNKFRKNEVRAKNNAPTKKEVILHPKDGIEAKFIEVTADQCRGDFKKMLKRFSKKVRKEELLKPFYERLAFHQTKGQLKRKQRNKGKFIFQKNEQKRLMEEKSSLLDEKIEF